MIKIETGTDNGILRDIADEVKKDEVKKIAKIGREMIDYIKNPKNSGVGLAAPQIGLSKRIFVVSLLSDWEDENYSTIMMINPNILEFSEETNLDVEGCLSVPGKQAKIERANKIKVEFLDAKGFKNTMVLNGLAARIVQHENDHLNGILLIDRINGGLPVNAIKRA